MFIDLQIAWRNLWRNRKRTLITISAIVLAVVLASFTSSMQEGTYSNMIDNIVKFYSGYLQVHHPGYWESRSINDSFGTDSLLSSTLNGASQITMAVPRLESYGLVSTGENTKGCVLIGIDPVKEDNLTGLSKWITEGSYLQQDDDGIILAVNIAVNLGVKPGDTLVLLSQGYHGSTASALMPLRGILKFPSPQLNGFAGYIDLGHAMDFFGTEGKITSMAIMVNDYLDVDAVARKIRQKLGDNYSVKTWKEINPDLVNMIEGDRAGAVIMKGILYMVIGFGILGTIIMMMAERRKEMGVMVAIGLHKYRLQRILCFESLYLGMLGVAMGVMISIPFISILVKHPVPLPEEWAIVYERFGLESRIYFSMITKVFFNQAVTIFVIAMVVALYPLLTIRKMKVVKALKGQ